MRKLELKKIVVRKETVRVLQRELLAQAGGGLGQTALCPMRMPYEQGG